MSNGDVEQELEAIKQVVGALQPLTAEGRDRVINYVFQSLGISTVSLQAPAPPSQLPSAADAGVAQQISPPPTQQHARTISDIRSFKETKQPSTANEMAAVLAYYLGELAPPESRKSEIAAADIEKYFKQAGFPLPAAASQTLRNAKNAGYLDPGAERGCYRLNPVGHNLVAHNLPSSEGSSTSVSPKTRRKRAAKPKQKKKSVVKKKVVKKKSSRK